MTPKQVLERVAKRVCRCDDRPGALPSDVIAGSCPGWRVVDRSNGRSAAALACAACNARNPASRRITDQMVQQLAEARVAAQTRTTQLALARAARQVTTHLREDPASLTVLCGHTLGRTLGGRRRHGWTYFLADTTCRECERLATMTPQERRAERLERLAQFTAKFSGKKAAILAAKALASAERARQIEEHRADAMVALDLVESQDATRTLIHEELIHDALHWAVTAYKHEHPKSGGERLHVLRDVVHGLGDQCCRFCGDVLRRGIQVGADRTMAGGFADISSHTIPCALKYLAGPLAPQPQQEGDA